LSYESAGAQVLSRCSPARGRQARIGHDSERAAIIYRHEVKGADLAITSGIDVHI
jgi:hypothetical protein